MADAYSIPQFHWADYLVFCASLLISLLIGVYFAVTGNKTTKDMLIAGRDGQIFPVAMSMLASFISAIYIIGVPAEIYYYGTMFSLVAIGYLFFGLVGAQIFVPIYHKMGITSAHQYLEERFSYPVRFAGTLGFITMMVLYMSVVMYAPALAFTIVTGVSIDVIIIVLGIVCTLYTVMGGMKAVIWTDTFQMMIIFGGLIAMLVEGTANNGGISYIWEKANNGSRIEFDVFDPDPRTRHTFWSQSFGALFQLISLVGANQIIIQRYLCVKKTRDAQISFYVSLIGAMVVLAMTTALGLILYAAYSDCDPLLSGKIQKPDQMVPLFMMETLGHLPGLPGLFTASVFSAALSTVSSAINSLAAVFLEDIIKPIRSMYNPEPISEKVATWTSRLISMIFGGVTIGMSYVAPLLGDLLTQISLSIFGTAGGPLMGLFCLGIFFPFVNSFGAIIGLLCSLAFTYWINVEAILRRYPVQPLPLSTAQCPVYNITMDTVTTGTPVDMYNTTTMSTPDIITDSWTDLDQLFRISYMWYGLISILTAIIVGTVVSLLTCGRRKGDPIRRELLFLVGDEACCCMPLTCRIFCRCGYRNYQQDNGMEMDKSGLDNQGYVKH